MHGIQFCNDGWDKRYSSTNSLCVCRYGAGDYVARIKKIMACDDGVDVHYAFFVQNCVTEPHTFDAAARNRGSYKVLITYLDRSPNAAAEGGEWVHIPTNVLNYNPVLYPVTSHFVDASGNQLRQRVAHKYYVLRPTNWEHKLFSQCIS